MCIDSTLGTNSYDFKLVAMLVVDEYGERDSSDIHTMQFLKAIKPRTGDIRRKWFMSADAAQ